MFVPRFPCDTFPRVTRHYPASCLAWISVLALTAATLTTSASAQQTSDQFHDAVARASRLSTLAEPGAQPFHLKLTTRDTSMRNPAYTADIELWWAAPDKWRRTVISPTFSQLAMQNGASYYESNSAADYLPYWLDELIQGSVAPISVEAFADVSADEDRPGCGNWEVHYGTGDQVFSSYSAVCFNPDGTVREMITEPMGLAFADYQEFGNKQVARRLTVWPGDRSDVTAIVIVLEPLEKAHHTKEDPPASHLFDAPTDTGFASRVRFVHVPEADLAPAYSPARPQLTWPASFTFPVDGVIAMEVQIDRNGDIRGVPFSISKNQALNSGALAQIRNWKFQPFLVDGAPVQVLTTLQIPYHLKYEPLGANGKEFPPISFGEHIKQYRSLNDLRAAGRASFRLRASFILAGGAVGKYEETWRSPEDWQRQVVMEGAALHQIRTGGNTSTQLDGDVRWKTEIAAVLSALQDRLPEARYTFLDADWGNSAVAASNVYPNAAADTSEPVFIRAARGAVDANNHPTSGQAYWFDSEGFLRASFADGSTTVNSDFAAWQQLQIPRRIGLFIGAVPTAVLTIDSIDPL